MMKEKDGQQIWQGGLFLGARLLYKRMSGRLHNWLFPPAPWIALLGVDGSGKSTVLAELRQSSDFAGFRGLFVLHRRPALLYRSRGSRADGRIAHYEKAPHGQLLSLLKLGVMWLDWWVGYFLLIRRRQSQRVLVVSDRHAMLDMMVDPARYRYGGSPQWVDLVMRFLPMPDGLILLDAPMPILLTRKQELTAVQAAELRYRYLALVEKYSHGFVVDAAQPRKQVADAVWQKVLKIENESCAE